MLSCEYCKIFKKPISKNIRKQLALLIAILSMQR